MCVCVWGGGVCVCVWGRGMCESVGGAGVCECKREECMGGCEWVESTGDGAGGEGRCV